MISGNTEKFLTPMRQISGKVEVVDTSTASQSGKAVRLEGCAVGVPLDVKLTGDISNFEGYTVEQYGKNLFDFSQYPFTNIYIKASTGEEVSSSGYSAIKKYVPVGHLKGQAITLNHPPAEVATGTNAGLVFYDAKKVYISGDKGYTHIVPDNAEYMRFSIPRAYADGTQIQVELGDTVSNYEAYREPQVFPVNADGVVSGVTAYAVNTLALGGANEYNITLTVSYSIEVPGDTYTAQNKLQSITIDRTGESKFFGFGISQKATIKLIDKECMCGLASGDKLSVLFDDVAVSPTFYIEKASRDEKTGNVSVEAQDALFLATKHTIKELALPADYTIGELADAVAAFLSIDIIRPDLSEFSTNYEGGANFDGSETVREALNAIAEATQTIYFINHGNALVFKRPSMDEAVAWEIDRTQYFDLTNKSQVELTGICSATELGDNVEATNGRNGITQYVRDNPFWELREDIGVLVDNAVAAMAGLTISQFNCSWRGNYLVEPGDKLALTTKDGNTIYSYLINDKIEYTGGLKQTSDWQIGEEKEAANPSTLGEVLKQTYAKVDKANKQIDIVVSEASATKEAVAALQLSTGLIEASVSDYKKATSEAIGDINDELEGLSQSVKATMTSEEVKIEIQKELSNGVDKVSTSKGYSFSDSGLAITSSQNNLSTNITEDGMEVKKGGTAVLTANNEGVEAIDLKATTFLVIGENSRFEDYRGNRTACFWIGR